jgi:hypothetical protein
VPPVAVIAFEYDVPCVPEGKLEVVIERAGTTTTNDRETDLVRAGFPESVTVAVKVVVPVAVGVPVIKPVLAARLSPAGRLPVVIDQE